MICRECGKVYQSMPLTYPQYGFLCESCAHRWVQNRIERNRIMDEWEKRRKGPLFTVDEPVPDKPAKLPPGRIIRMTPPPDK